MPLEFRFNPKYFANPALVGKPLALVGIPNALARPLPSASSVKLIWNKPHESSAPLGFCAAKR